MNMWLDSTAIIDAFDVGGAAWRGSPRRGMEKAFNPDQARDSHGMWTTGADAPHPDYMAANEGEHMYNHADDAERRLSDHLSDHVNAANSKLLDAYSAHEDVENDEPDREEVGDKEFDKWNDKNNKSGQAVADAAMNLRQSLIDHAGKVADEIGKLDEQLREHEDNYGRREHVGKAFNPDQARDYNGRWTIANAGAMFDKSVLDHINPDQADQISKTLDKLDEMPGSVSDHRDEMDGHATDARDSEKDYHESIGAQDFKDLGKDEHFDAERDAITSHKEDTANSAVDARDALDADIRNKISVLNELDSHLDRFTLANEGKDPAAHPLEHLHPDFEKRDGRVGKDLTVGDVHTGTALGNEDPKKRRSKDFLTTITEVKGGGRIVELPDGDGVDKAYDPNQPRGKNGRWSSAGSPSGQKTTRPGNSSSTGMTIGQHATRIKAAWNNNSEFDQAMKDLKADKSMKLDDVRQIHSQVLGRDVSRSKGRDANLHSMISSQAGEARDNARANKIRGVNKSDKTVLVHVIRHGSTKMNNHSDDSKDRIRGWIDVPLNEDGRKDAQKAAKKADKAGLKVLMSSDLSRASETADIIGKEIGVTPVTTPKLRPWDLGKFAGKSSKDVYPEILPYVKDHPDEPVPEGESFNDFRHRAMAGLKLAVDKADGQPLGIVTHYRNGRLYAAWDEAGQPSDHSIDEDEFSKKGGPPGDLTEMEVNLKRLAGKGGAGDDAVEKLSAEVILAAIAGDVDAMAILAKADMNASLKLQPLDDRWAKSPFPWDQSALIYIEPEEMKPFLGALTDPDKLPVKTVRLNNVVAIQDRVDPLRVQSMMDNEPEKLPVVVRLNGRKIIVDGHHRMAAKWVEGRKTAQTRYLDLNPKNADKEAFEEELTATSDGSNSPKGESA